MNYIDLIENKTTIIPKLDNGKYNFNADNVILPKRIDIDKQNDLLKKIILKKFRKSKKLLILDFHGVADLYESNELIPSNLDKCIISFIGHSQNTKASTINSIVERIKTGEIKLGIIVYIKNENPILGTKGWILNFLRKILPNLQIFFIDDSITNIKCVKNIKDKYINTFYINKKYEPKIKLNKILNKLNKI